MAIFMDVELVAIDEAEFPDAFTVAFDVIYAGETWCRSLVWVTADLSARLNGDERAVAGAARDALLNLLAVEVAPVSYELRLGSGGPTVLGRGIPGAQR